MSVNRRNPHLCVLSEDEANRQIATGFQKYCDTNQIQVVPEARGWAHVCKLFVSDHISVMHKYDERFMLLLVDFDNNMGRMKQVQAYLPPVLAPRIFIIGTLSEPESLRRTMGLTYEKIGEQMAHDCRNGSNSIWGHPLLAHNAPEIVRFCNAFGNSLFQA